jgi:hypothetical protein
MSVRLVIDAINAPVDPWPAIVAELLRLAPPPPPPPRQARRVAGRPVRFTFGSPR